jgi:hypothetical protein
MESSLTPLIPAQAGTQVFCVSELTVGPCKLTRGDEKSLGPRLRGDERS